jgi:hypothetical protein
MKSLRICVFSALSTVLLAIQPARATSLVWKGNGSSSDWLTASNWNPAQSPTGNDSLVFSSSTASLSPIADIGDVNLAGVNFSVSGYQIYGRNSQDEFCSRSVYASQASSGVGIKCRFRTLYGNATITTVNSAALLSFNGSFQLDSGATVTVAGNGQTNINDLTTQNSSSAATALSLTGAGVVTLTGVNTASNTTITVGAGSTLQVGQTSTSGGTMTVVAVNGTLCGGGVCDTVVNHGVLAPSTTSASFFTLSIGGKLTCPLDTSNPSYVYFLVGGAKAGQYSSLVLDGATDFSGSYLSFALANGYLPALGDSFTLAVVQGSTNTSAIPFRGAPEGFVFHVNRYVFSVTYKGGTNGKSVVVTRVPTPPPSIGPLTRSAQEAVTLPISGGFSGEEVQVEISPDLQNWSVAQTYTLDSNGTATFTQTNSAARAFYRVRAVDP